MKIETKFEPDQPVFLLYQNKVWKAEIKTIEIKVNLVYTEIFYWIKEHPIDQNYNKQFKEDQLFATKELLLKSL